MTWDPMRDLRALQERLASHRTDSWAPPIDVYETPVAYVITVEVPGLSRDQIDLAVEHSRLTIRGRRPARSTESSESVKYHQVERGHGPFARTFEFAQVINVDEVSADLTQGVLTVTLPKTPDTPARKIEVR
jgi:HSP20 family protein